MAQGGDGYPLSELTAAAAGGAEAAEPPDPNADPTFRPTVDPTGDLEYLQTIGTGTFAKVFLCKNKLSKRYEAVKVLAMADVIRLKQETHVRNEKEILLKVQHPFIIDLLWYSKDASCLYMGFPFIPGGELFSYLRSGGRFPATTTQFYGAEIVSAMSYLHSLSIAYRDLKPENLLLDVDGHLKLTDFGFAKRLSTAASSSGQSKTWTLCGTPEYLAPEIIQSKGHDFAVDWWALGILLFEMSCGYPPFFDDNPFRIYDKILVGKFDSPRHIEPLLKDLIKKLLVVDRTRRLGSSKHGSEDVKRHRWFKSLDWNEVEKRQLKAPIVPSVAHDGDTKNYDPYHEIDPKKRPPPVSDRERSIFEAF